MATDCLHCGEKIPSNFQVCWNCGAAADGSSPPTRLDVLTPKPPSAEVAPERHRVKLGLLHWLALITVVSLWGACSVSVDAMFVFTAVVVTNFVGVLIGLLVTHGWGLPNDGSLPPGCRDQDGD